MKSQKSVQKNIFIKLLFILGLFFLTPQHVEAQFFKKLAKKAKEKINREAENRSERRVNKQIDKEFDDAEDVIDGKEKKKKKKKDKNKNNETAQNDNNNSNNEEANKTNEIKKGHQTKLSWSKYDFIPGDTVIFEDGPSTEEENGEFPSRWDLAKGNAEIVEVNGKPAIIFPTRHSDIVPYLKNSEEDYLPEIFTIEFDCFFKKDEASTSYSITLYDIKNQNSSTNKLEFDIDIDYISDNQRHTYNGVHNIDNNDGIWRHISIAFTKGKLKVYMDELRLINIPHFEHNPTGITLSTAGNNDADIKLIKNIRIAKGGVKYYDRVLSEGKIIVNGIKFDVNKATLKPESIGPINKIYKLMVKNPELNFSVEGHTDADGGDDINMTLSKKRGKTVMEKLINMGIDKKRLKSDGFGESKPIANNTTAEGKANNRRVEFVKY